MWYNIVHFPGWALPSWHNNLLGVWLSRNCVIPWLSPGVLYQRGCLMFFWVAVWSHDIIRGWVSRVRGVCSLLFNDLHESRCWAKQCVKGLFVHNVFWPKWFESLAYYFNIMLYSYTIHMLYIIFHLYSSFCLYLCRFLSIADSFVRYTEAINEHGTSLDISRSGHDLIARAAVLHTLPFIASGAEYRTPLVTFKPWYDLVSLLTNNEENVVGKLTTVTKSEGTLFHCCDE